MYCLAGDAAHLGAVARDFCPFPEYSLNPLFINMLSVNSSRHLSEHYAAVQASLTPQQQQAFTQTLRRTFGREGKVSYGGVGVVALSLAVLFDSVSRQVQGQYESDQEPIPGLFFKDLRGYYAPAIYTISKYLRLVPHIANNPARMRDETIMYMKQLHFDDQAFQRLLEQTKQDDVTVLNGNIGQFMQWPLHLHLHRLTNESFAAAVVESVQEQQKEMETPQPPAPDFDHNVNFNLNCDPDKSSKQFVDEVNKSDHSTQNAFKKCEARNMEDSKTWVHHIARLLWTDTVKAPIYLTGNRRQHIAQKEDFDLKVGALGNWATR